MNEQLSLIVTIFYHNNMFTDVPAAPDAPTVTDVTESSCTVYWAPPVSDGGSPVTGYYVERYSDVSPRWLRVNRAPVSELTLLIPDLVKGTDYIFRVIAENKKGESQPSEPSEHIEAKNPYGMLLSNNYQFKQLSLTTIIISNS